MLKRSIILKKIFAFIFIFAVVLSVKTAAVNANAVIVNNDIEKNPENSLKTENSAEGTTDNNLNNAESYDTENNSAINDIEENYKISANLGNTQYSITEAPKASRVIYPDKPMIAITYDDGPSQYTPEILDILKKHNSAATFFVLGSRVSSNKDVLKRMIGEGSQIGNHSYNHKNLTTISDEELYKQIQGTDDLVYMATGYTPSIMRPPYGITSGETDVKINRPIIKWSVDTRDWESRNSNMIIKSLENVKDGDIILMHDLYDSTLEASRIAIPQLINKSFQLVTIEELFEYRGAVSIAGQQYYHLHK